MGDEQNKADPVLSQLQGISSQLERMETKIDSGVRRAVVAGGIAGAVSGSLVGPLISSGLEIARAKLGL